MKKFLILAFLFSIIPLSFAQTPIGFKLSSQAAYTVTTTSTKWLEADSYRNYLLCQNNGAVVVSLKVGSVQSGSEGIQIAAGGYYEPFVAPTGSIFMKTASSTASVVCIEGIK